MTDASGRSGVRPEIELAWRRAQMFGLDPGMEVRGSVLSDIDRCSRLVVAAEPVLDRMAQDLVDTRFSVLLADSASIIVDRRYGQRSRSCTRPLAGWREFSTSPGTWTMRPSCRPAACRRPREASRASY